MITRAANQTIKLLSLTLMAVMLSLLPASQTRATSFNQNRLIDDVLFTDTDSMSVSEIQAFLDANGSLLANWTDNVDMIRPDTGCVVHKATGKTAPESTPRSSWSLYKKNRA